jgi:glutamate/tyrosine decarboxylase-like PLP-dependent enzyme
VTEPRREEIDQVLDLVGHEARAYLEGLDERALRPPDVDARADAFGGSLPEDGDGAVAALEELLKEGLEATVASTGPRFFHFVTGGVTPAALGADWLTSTLDQNAVMWTSSPLGSRLATVSIGWLLDLFGLPRSWGGSITTGATMANFTALLAARRWWAQHHGVDVDEEGLTGLPQPRVFSGGYVHASARKALGMLGIGRSNIRILTRDDAGRLDLPALRRELEALGGDPAILLATAGEVNAGDFDPIYDMADLAEAHGAWLHVDGAFGLFAALAPRTAHLVEGIEGAHSVIADGHKWLNVPYDSGFAFVRDPALIAGPFAVSGAYLASIDDPRPNLSFTAPEMSQRARSLALWATLRAYGRRGHRAMVERHLELAERLAARVDDAPELERLADVTLNIVCFRYRPDGVPEESLDDLNRRIGAALLEDGRVYAGTTTYRGKVAFRPAIVNWRSRDEDVDLITEVIRELGDALTPEFTADPD